MKTMLRFTVTILLCLIVCLCTIPFAFAETVLDSGTCGAQGDNLTWTLYDNGELVIEGTGEMEDFIFDSNMQTYSYPWQGDIKTVRLEEGITSIGDCAFNCCQYLTSIIIPSGVTKIGSSMCVNCDRLTNITLPDTLVSIPAQAFDGCYSLKSITIPSGVKSIGDSAFMGCSSLTSLSIPDSVTSIGKSAFSYCDSLTNITIPSSVTSIDGAFSECSNLKTAGPIGSGCNCEFGWTTEIPANAFNGCRSLTSITIPSGIVSIGYRAFSHCYSLENITIPSGVKNIGYQSFHYCQGLKSIIIPFGVTSIGDMAFMGCSSLTNITLLSSVTNLGSQVFRDCSNLKSAGPIGSGCNYEFGWTTEIPANAFDCCHSLKSITIPSGVTDIGDRAFFNIDLVSITIPLGVTRIGVSAFQHCDYLASITIPESLKIIGNYAFDCNNLTEIWFRGAPPTINNSAFRSVKANAYYPVDNGWTAANMKNYGGNLTWIPFAVPDFILPAGLTTIEEEAFTGGAFTYVKLSESTVSVGRRAFADCPNLIYIYIPEATISIDPNAFEKTNNLTIIGKDGSYAESYAQNYGFTFEAVS